MFRAVLCEAMRMSDGLRPVSVRFYWTSHSSNVQGKTIDLSKTYTTEFVVKANATH